MRSGPTIWEVLGIQGTTDSAAIRRAYAAKLKVTKPEEDPEGFKALRAAYESAVHFARSDGAQATIADASPTTQRDSETPSRLHVESASSSQATSAADAEIAVLRAAFQTLHQYLTASRNPPQQAVKSWLDKIIYSKALDNVDFEARVELDLANLLAGTTPASDSLLLPVIRRFNWTDAQRQLDLTPAMLTILTRHHDLQFLHQLRFEKHPYSNAFEGLQRWQFSLFRWVRVHINKAGHTTEYQLLQHIRMQHPTLLSELNPDVVAWWDRIASRPQPSFVLMVLGALVVLISLFGSLATESPGYAAQSVATCVGVTTLLVLAKLYLFDWPRILMHRKWPAGIPLALRFGWAPLMVGCLLLRSVVPSIKALNLVVAAVAIVAMAWAWLVSKPMPRLASLPSGNLFIMLVVINGALLVWWFVVIQQLPDGIAFQLIWPDLAAMCASVLGLYSAIAYFLEDTSSRWKRTALSGIALFAILVAVTLWFLSPYENLHALCIALVMIAVAVARPMGLLLSRRQQEIRFGWMIASFILLAVISERLEMLGLSPTLFGGGIILLSTIVLCMLMSLWNEKHGRIATAHEE